jgi:uncharacterized protein
MNNLIKHLTITLLLLLLSSVAMQAQIPERPNPPQLVNDFTNTLTPQEVQALERKLVSFNDTTSNQITIVIVPDFGGMDKADFAYQTGEKWKVGQKAFDNGVVVALRPKTNRHSGEVFIAVGYGLEPVIPDAIANRIIDIEMIPAFDQNNYYQGLSRGTDKLMGLAAGEFSSEQYKKETSGGGLIGLLVPLLALFIMIFAIKRGQSSQRDYGSSSRASGGMLAAMLLMGMGSRHSGNWNSFSSGSGGFGGGSGGFGGFGGGSFGGGGAGGSW